MVAQKYRWDFVGLSTDVKPTPATSDKVVDGSTFYESDTSKLYVYCKDNWYERKALGGGGGGGGVTPVQTTGTSTTDVMSQNATSSMVFADPGTDSKVKIGAGASARSDLSIAIGTTATDNGAYYNTLVGSNSGVGNARSACVSVGFQASANADNSVVIGRQAKIQQTSSQSSVALGAWAEATRKGEVNVGAGSSGNGYNNTNYRLIGAVHDGIDAHDCLTVGQANALIDAINSALNTNIAHIGS